MLYDSVVYKIRLPLRDGMTIWNCKSNTFKRNNNQKYYKKTTNTNIFVDIGGFLL